MLHVYGMVISAQHFLVSSACMRHVAVHTNVESSEIAYVQQIVFQCMATVASSCSSATVA
jgi:hypothetical protein